MEKEKKLFKKCKGFTLLEMLVVVLIIGILAAVALPQYQKATDKARFAEVITASKSLAQSIEMYYMVNNDYPYYWKQLDVEIQGCTETNTARYDLMCKNFTIDLKDEYFNAFLGERNKNLPFNISLIYFFKMGTSPYAGRFRCVSSSTRGKRVCKSLCDSELCYF